MFLDSKVAAQLNVLLGTRSEPHRYLLDGAWIETGCIRWPVPQRIPPPVPALSSSLQDAVKRISQTVMADQDWHGKGFDPKSYADQFEALLAREPQPIQQEYWASKPGIEAASNAYLHQEKGREELLANARAILAGQGVVAYKGELVWVSPTVSSFSSIVIAPTSDHFEILGIERTQGENRFVSTDRLTREMREIDAQFGIDITGASTGAVAFLLKRIPAGEEATALGERLFALAPDIYEQPREFAEGRVVLWWD